LLYVNIKLGDVFALASIGVRINGASTDELANVGGRCIFGGELAVGGA
jgi:hypothetical protein